MIGFADRLYLIEIANLLWGFTDGKSHLAKNEAARKGLPYLAGLAVFRDGTLLITNGHVIVTSYVMEPLILTRDLFFEPFFVKNASDLRKAVIKLNKRRNMYEVYKIHVVYNRLINSYQYKFTDIELEEKMIIIPDYKQFVQESRSEKSEGNIRLNWKWLDRIDNILKRHRKKRLTLKHEGTLLTHTDKGISIYFREPVTTTEKELKLFL